MKKDKVQKAPNRDKLQNTVEKSRAWKLYTQLLTKSYCVIIADDTILPHYPGFHYLECYQPECHYPEYSVNPILITPN